MAEVTIIQRANGSGTFEIDGQDFSNVIARGGVHVLRQDENSLPKVEVTLAATTLSHYMPDALLVVDRETFDLLVRLGWMPPPGTSRPLYKEHD